MPTPVKIIFFGTPDFAAEPLRALIADERYQVGLVVTQPARPAGRGAKVQPTPVQKIAEESKIPVMQPQRIKKELKAFLAQANAHGPFDVGVVIAFGQILPQAVLDLPSRGCVNVHASLLPRWRGAAPIQRAIMQGDAESGVCLMKMDAGLDTGDVYSSAKTAIAGDTFESLYYRLQKIGTELLTNQLVAIAAGQLAATPQPAAGVTYAEKISNEEALIDWKKPAAQVANQIHGLSPIPGAYTTFQGKRLKIFRVSAKTPRSGTRAFSPGMVTLSDRACLEVQCADGVLAIEELQLEGKSRLKVEDFLRGAGIEVGAVLGG